MNHKEFFTKQAKERILLFELLKRHGDIVSFVDCKDLNIYSLDFVCMNGSIIQVNLVNDRNEEENK